MGLLLLMVAIAPAADLTGKWAGSFKFNEQDVPLTVALKGDSEITGTVDGMPSGTAQIKDGKLQGDNLTFWITIEYQGSPVKLVYKGKVAGNEITLDFGTEDGSWGTQFTAKKT
jgi:riboflavin synthase alpha subunit